MSVVETILDNRFFQILKQGKIRNIDSLWEMTNIELFITSSCNQKCEYCYLYNNKEIYPEQARNPSIIKNNLKILFDWFLENNFKIFTLDLFSGEIWHSDFGISILEIILSYVKRGLLISQIILPTNCTFILYPKYFFKMDQLINDFKEENCRLILSGSIDGKIVDSLSRKAYDDKITAEKNTDEFYDKLFSFFSHHYFLFHPMVAAENVKYWKENFQWWDKQCKKYGFDTNESVMMLEVRNDNWTDESIKEYLDFLNFVIEKIFKEYFNNDPRHFTNYLFNLRNYSKLDSKGSRNGYFNYILADNQTVIGCTISNTLTIRLGDLAIAPCHRTAYDNLLYGYFTVENNKITGIKENNSQMASRILLQNNIMCTPKCDKCIYNKFCLMGCYGSQLESEKDPFMPIESVCKLFKAKINFLIKKYEELGVLDAMEKVNKTEPLYNYTQELLKNINNIRRSSEYE